MPSIITVSKQEARQALALGTGADLAGDGQMDQELLHVRRTEVPGMPPLMDVNVAPEPRYLGLFGAEGRGPDPQLVPPSSRKPGGFTMLPISPAS